MGLWLILKDMLWYKIRYISDSDSVLICTKYLYVSVENHLDIQHINQSWNISQFNIVTWDWETDWNLHVYLQSHINKPFMNLHISKCTKM